MQTFKKIRYRKSEEVAKAIASLIAEGRTPSYRNIIATVRSNVDPNFTVSWQYCRDVYNKVMGRVFNIR